MESLAALVRPGVSDKANPGPAGSPSRPTPNLWRYTAIGAELFSPIGGSVAGYYIDEHFHTGSV
jgi:hypothetical protein